MGNEEWDEILAGKIIRCRWKVMIYSLLPIIPRYVCIKQLRKKKKKKKSTFDQKRLQPVS